MTGVTSLAVETFSAALIPWECGFMLPFALVLTAALLSFSSFILLVTSTLLILLLFLPLTFLPRLLLALLRLPSLLNALRLLTLALLFPLLTQRRNLATLTLMETTNHFFNLISLLAFIRKMRIYLSWRSRSPLYIQPQ